METVSPGQIYLSEQRGQIETNAFRRICTFNYEGYQAEHRHAFGKLEVLNDEISAAGQTTQFKVNHAAYVVIIPVTGQVMIKNVQGKVVTIDVGDVFVEYKPADSTFILQNCYETDWINFLYLQFQVDEITNYPAAQTFNFNFETAPDELIKVVSEGDILTEQILPFSIYLGRFNGRKDTLFTLKNKASLLFAFVIAGAFEMQGRLLHERDGLALWELEEADLEALSNNAVMLMVEMQFKSL